ncbi:MAG: hypothetical protein U5L11_16710 [Arhodomonas sp.]|nr:hypothetical protein [Arhodomonas sp.]
MMASPYQRASRRPRACPRYRPGNVHAEANAAEVGCPVSKLFNAEITLDARLEG